MIAGKEMLLTVDQFLEQRPEMPECGQWSELQAGRPVHFQPPDVDHGTAILNLSKSMADYFQSHSSGYACFDLGLWISDRPDTVLFPSIVVFLKGKRFAESDQPVTRTRPAIVIELMSTGDRRRYKDARLAQFLSWGVGAVWQIDPHDKTLTTISAEQPQLVFTGDDFVENLWGMPGLAFSLPSLFEVPEWYK